MRKVLQLVAAAAAGTVAGGVGVIVYATRTVLADMCDTSPVGRSPSPAPRTDEAPPRLAA